MYPPAPPEPLPTAADPDALAAASAPVADHPGPVPPGEADAESDGWEDGDVAEADETDAAAADELAADGAAVAADAGGRVARVRKRRRPPRLDSLELRLRGRRALCLRIEDLAPRMQKMVKLRILTGFLPSVRGLEDDDLTRVLRDDAAKLSDRARVEAALSAPDPDHARGQLKAMILAVLLQEETHALPERRLDEKVIEYERGLADRARTLDLSEMRKGDPDRWHHFDTYRIVLEAAWADDGTVSPDEARLLGVLRRHLGITQEEHWLLGCLLKRFPKAGGVLHTADEVNDARKELQRQGVLWNYRDELGQSIDVIPAEVAAVARGHAGQELQAVNFRRLASHDLILLSDLRDTLQRRGLDRAGNKADLIDRVAGGTVRPSELLGDLDRDKLAAVCGSFGLKTSGAKADLIARVIDFYDDLTFEERETKDEREGWYNDYELLAGRAYAELRAKKVIAKDLDIQYLFEDATEFLFQVRLRLACDRARKENRADGRLPLDGNQCLLWDCKSAEAAVNLQDHLETQFEGYLRKEREGGVSPIGFLVVGPSFTPQSVVLANKFKARTGWDVALVQADALRHLADRWAATEPEKAFPVRFLNRTELIDRERAEFLLSLA